MSGLLDFMPKEHREGLLALAKKKEQEAKDQVAKLKGDRVAEHVLKQTEGVRKDLERLLGELK